MERNLYQDLKSAGCKLDHHESDLYVKLDPTAIDILRKHDKAEYRPAGPARGEEWIKLTGCTMFRSPIDGELWIDVPFAYAPFWERKQASAEVS